MPRVIVPPRGRYGSRWAGRVLLLALVLASISSCGDEDHASVRVGVLIPYVVDTIDFFRSMQMAVDEVNAAGGVDGKPIELLFYDVTWDPEISFASFHQAIDDGAVAVIGGLSSALATREAAAALEERRPLVGCCSTSDELTTIQSPGVDRFFFRVAPPDRLQSVVIANVAYDRPELGCRALAIVHTADAYGIPLADAVTSAFEARGGDVVADVSHAFFQQDFQPQVDAVAAAGPDCILLASNVDDARAFRTRWTQTGQAEVRWLASDALVGDAVGETYADPHLSDGIYVVFPWSFGRPSADDFLVRFQQAYGHVPAPSSAGAYDAAAVLSLAIVRAGAGRGDAIRDALFDVANPGGETIDVGALGQGVEALARGDDVDYLGLSGQLDFDPCGDVVGTYALLELDASLPDTGYAVLATGLAPGSVPTSCPE